MNKYIGEIPENYNPKKDWRLIVIGLVGLLAFADIFLLFARDLGVVYSLTSAILSGFFIYEVITRLKNKKTFMGYKFSLYLAIFYVLIDLFIYLV